MLVGGMDAGVEDLLLDAGGVWNEPARELAASGPWVVLVFSARRLDAGEAARRRCLDHGWPADWSEDGSGGRLRVQERVAARLLAQLARAGAAPDSVGVRTSELTPAQVRGIRAALPSRSALEAHDEDGHTNRS